MADGSIPLFTLGYDAAAALTQACAVKMSDANTVTPVTAEGDLIVGVSRFSVSAAEITKGKGCTCDIQGAVLMLVGAGGVTFGTIGVSDATGKVVASNTGARPLGLVLATGAAGEYVPVFLTPGLPLIP